MKVVQKFPVARVLPYANLLDDITEWSHFLYIGSTTTEPNMDVKLE